MLEKYAVEISLLWDNDTGKVFSEFIRTYKEVLNKLYLQQVCIRLIEDYNKEQNNILELMIDSNEIDKRTLKNATDNKLFETINELDRIYDRIINENLEQKLIDDLKL